MLTKRLSSSPPRLRLEISSLSPLRLPSLYKSLFKGLLCFLMSRMLLAEPAVLVEFKTIWIILFVFVGAVVAAVALRAFQRDIVAHLLHPLRFPFIAQKI